MYAPFFGLKQDPFSIAPDPRYLFMSERHREALAHLLYGVGGGGGFVLLTGEIGTGKTTVCRCFLEQIPPQCNVAYIFNPKLTVIELLQSVCDEFGIAVAPTGAGAPTVKDYLDPLNAFLLRTHATGQNNVLIIDEAQNLSADVLEQLRLLTNLETSERKLLQIVLIGQPELRRMLARPELEQLAQRVIARYHLDALTAAETAQYIAHRLSVAGMTTAQPFDARAMQRVHRLTGGVPRRINLLCDRALLGAYAGGHAAVTAAIIDKAAGEVFEGAAPASPVRRSAALNAAAGVLAGGALVGAVWWVLGSGGAARPSARDTASAAPAGSASAVAAGASAAAPVAAAIAASAPAAGAASVGGAGAPATGVAGANGWIATEADAWRALARTWNLPSLEGDPCAAAQRQQVQCYRSDGISLALVRQLGRPGVLTLVDDTGKRGFVLLTGLNDQAATLVTTAGAQTVPLAQLAGVWRGEFATLWRVPDGPRAQALATQLAVVEGQPASDEPARLSLRALRPRVQAFQVAQGLVPDGVAGPMTQMQLNRATGADEPRLLAER